MNIHKYSTLMEHLGFEVDWPSTYPYGTAVPIYVESHTRLTGAQYKDITTDLVNRFPHMLAVYTGEICLVY